MGCSANPKDKPPATVARLQTRTPPDVKWLLNERAALAGEVSKAEATQAGLWAKRERLT
jgi:apolipoprotein N-acyltransferase